MYHILVEITQTIIGWSLIIGLPVIFLRNQSHTENTLRQYARSHGYDVSFRGDFQGILHDIPIRCDFTGGKGGSDLTITIEVPQRPDILLADVKNMSKEIAQTLPPPRPHVIRVLGRNEIRLTKSTSLYGGPKKFDRLLQLADLVCQRLSSQT